MNNNHNKSELSTPLHNREGQGGGSATQYIELFEQCEAMICKHSTGVLNAPRAKAFADFKQQGFPTRKIEAYKYTDASKLFAPDYGLNLNRLDIPVNPYDAFRCDVPNLSTALYFMVNDRFYKVTGDKPQATGGHAARNLSFVTENGVLLGSLKELAEQYPELLSKYYGKLADTSKDAIVALNTMLAQDGLLLYVPKGVVLEKPIQLVNILRADVNFMVNRRVLIIIEDGAQAHGAVYKGRPVGSIGEVAAWSYCQDKIITTGGEGGAVTTNNKDIWNKIWSYKDHGKSYNTVFNKKHHNGFKWLVESFGTNLRISEMQAALGICGYNKLPERIALRKRNATIYKTTIDKFDCIITPEVPEDIVHSYYKYCCRINLECLKAGWDRNRIVSEISVNLPCFSGTCWNVSAEKCLGSFR